MIWNIVWLIILVIWMVMYIKNKKAILVLPYLLMSFITPFYNILDRIVFVEIFGCGCVPSAQTNMVNIDFNANDLRLVVYNVLAILISVLGICLSKKLDKKKSKVTYIISILVINLLVAYKICQLYMWA